MKNAKIFLWSSLILLTVLWLLADSSLPNPFTYFSFRNVFVQYSGIIAIACMSLSLYLAIRPKILEKKLHGLDKIYRLHKWLGIAAFAFSILHWWFAKGTKWMVQWGILTRPQRPNRGGGQETANALQHFLGQQREIAEGLGEWIFYLFFILIIFALVKAVPYRFFKKTHKWLAIVFLVLVYHSIILFKSDYWLQPIGWVMAFLFVVGVVSSIVILAGKVGSNRKAQGRISGIEYFPELKTSDITIELEDKWKGHKAGQFAFVKFDDKEPPHPYTISSQWNASTREIHIIIKALGDYTKTLHNKLKIGEKVVVEGPYGNFTFQDSKSKQIWIGGGIGLTPFIGKMKELATIGGTHKEITFFHTTKQYSAQAIENLKKDAEAAQINYVVMINDQDGYLTGEKLSTAIPDWKEYSIWFSGPVSFKKSLMKYFKSQGYDMNHFHQEIFTMR